jgi:hypothetical protein
MPKRELPTCLFCGSIIMPPEEKNTDFGQIMYGRCDCGALYVCEPTGHNQGQALADAMILASPEGIENIDLGVNFDLRERDYDCKTHQYMDIKNYPFVGKLFFIKSISNESKNILSVMQEKMKISKKDFLSLLDKMDFETIEKISLHNQKVFGWLISVSYDREDPISWKAIEAMGHIAEVYISHDKIEPLRNTIRKLLWSMSEESGGIGWRSVELIGEIIYAEPSLFEDIIPILWSQRDEESFLESVLRSMIKLTKKINLTDYIRIEDTELAEFLNHKNDEIKALTAILLKKIKNNLPISEEIKNTILSIYNNGRIIRLKVSEAEKYL